MPAQLLGDLFDLTRRYALDIHLRQRSHQRLLAPLVALKHLRAEPSLPILRHSQLQLPHPCDQRSSVVPAPVSLPTPRPLALLRAQAFVHLPFQHILNDSLQQTPKRVVLLSERFHEDCLPILTFRVILFLGHVCSSAPLPGSLFWSREHHDPFCFTYLSRIYFAELLKHNLPWFAKQRPKPSPCWIHSFPGSAVQKSDAPAGTRFHAGKNGGRATAPARTK